ncbi:hypothetical protein AB6C48_09880 [Vibrio splendidus]
MKKALLIAPDTFQYYRFIKNELECKNVKTDFVNSLASQNNLYRAAIRLFPSIFEKVQDIYFKINTVKTDYDYIIVIKGEGVTESTLSRLKKKNINAKFIYYTWDSVSNLSNKIYKSEIFQKKYTFDYKDSSLGFVHQPLFFSSLYSKENKVENNNKLFFVGTLHSDRYNDIYQIAQDINKSRKDENSYIYIYYPSKLLFFIKKNILNSFSNVDFKKIKFRKLPQSTTASLMKSSAAVLDICHSNQSGLTMRTIETLGCQKKLITNNRNILRYDFYNPSNVYIIDCDSRDLSDFIVEDYAYLNDNIYNSYSLSFWVDRVVFGEHEEKNYIS